MGSFRGATWITGGSSKPSWRARVADRMRRGRRARTPAHLVALGICLGITALVRASACLAAEGLDCNRCHGSHEFLAGKRSTPEGDAALFVPDSLLSATKHAQLVCADCHRGYDRFPHAPEGSTLACASCHEAAEADFVASAHGRGAVDAPTCVRCHGTHRILGSDDRASPTHPLNEARLCGSCHGDPGIVASYFTDPADSVARSAVERYHETVHGMALERDGLVVSATCSDCHGAHRALPSDDPGSSTNPKRVSETCGQCHVGVVEQFRRSAHGMTAAAASHGERDPPTCTTCHSVHGVVQVTEAWRVDVVEECQHCHEAAYETYFETQHGKITRLRGLAAKCSDCHTPHGNLPASDPASSVHRTNLATTCGKCHESPSSRFVAYHPHPDVRDRAKFPILYWTRFGMSALIIGVFGFFGTHSLLWLARASWELRRAGPPPAADAPDGGEPASPPPSASAAREPSDSDEESA